MPVIHKIFPKTPQRSLKRNQWMRDILQENHLSAKDFVLPVFVCEDHHPRDIASLPGVVRYSVYELQKSCEDFVNKGVSAIAIFPYTDSDKRSLDAREAFNDHNLVCRAVRAIKEMDLPLGIIVDVALDPYTSHGHDGLLRGGEVCNKRSVEALTHMAEVLAHSGADVLALSDMMDQRVSAIRKALDYQDFSHIPLISYVKYSSAFYGPFRDAIGAKHRKLNKDTYQLNFANTKDALIRIKQDVSEGADMIIIKPGLPYLDIIREATQQVDVPIFAYHVSGEYAALKLAAQHQAIDYERALLESMMSFKRAGTRAIFTYATLECINFINQL